MFINLKADSFYYFKYHYFRELCLLKMVTPPYLLPYQCFSSKVSNAFNLNVVTAPYTHVRTHAHTRTRTCMHTHINTHTQHIHATFTCTRHTHTPLTFNNLSEDNGRVFNPKNWTNDTILAGIIMLVPCEILLSVK